MPGSVSAMVSSTEAGSSTPMISSSWLMIIALPVSFKKLAASPRLFDDTGSWSKLSWSMKM